jgi:hypothetical protein
MEEEQGRIVAATEAPGSSPGTESADALRHSQQPSEQPRLPTQVARIPRGADVAALATLTGCGVLATSVAAGVLSARDGAWDRWWFLVGIAVLSGTVALSLLVRATLTRRKFHAEVDQLLAVLEADPRYRLRGDLAEKVDEYRRQAVANGELAIAARLDRALRPSSESTSRRAESEPMTGPGPRVG